MAIVGHYSLSEVKQRDQPLWWHTKGLSYTSSGYGRKIPTHRMVQLPTDKPHVWRRVYVAIYSNSGTAYILKGKDWIVITD